MVYVIGQDETNRAAPATDVDVDNFMEEVIQRSRQLPVVVDFWAPWCGPCKNLTPILEELATNHADSFHLVKINIDNSQQLAAQFGVRSVPTVFMVIDGNVVDGFQGAQAQNVVEQFLSKHIKLDGQTANDPIQNLLDQGRVSEAVASLQEDGSEESLIRLASIYVRMQKFDDARASLDKVKQSHNTPNFKSAAAALEYFELAHDSESEEVLQVQISQDSNNWGAHYKLAAIHMVRGDPEFALETLLKIVKQDRSYKDDLGRKGLIKAFDMLGHNHPLVPKYRSKLAAMLN